MFERIEESEQLARFQDAYQEVTGELLERVRKSERPDFVCRRPNGTLVGVEFTLVMRDAETCFWDDAINGIGYMDSGDAVIAVGEAIWRKAKKLAEPNWQLPHSSILVVSMPDSPLSQIAQRFDLSLRREFAETGFGEIWMADHSGMEAFGSIELFGLVPERWWGYHRRHCEMKHTGPTREEPKGFRLDLRGDFVVHLETRFRVFA